MIYKIVPKALWEAAQQAGVFEGAGIDLADGYIHFSSAEQVRETAEKHFAGQQDLLLVAIDPQAVDLQIPGKLVFEPSRGGALFPHLYAPLPTSLATWARPMPWLESGVHDLPELGE